MNKKENILFLVLGAFFVANALIAELIGCKLFSVEKTFGFQPLDLSVLGQEHIALTMSAGSISWPLVFILTDIINEYFGRKGVKLLSLLTAALILYAFLMLYIAIKIPPADAWFTYNPDIKPDINTAFAKILGQGQNIIIGSITAFLISQWFDVLIFQRLRKITGDKYIGIRAVVSTLFSQLIDSFVVSFVAFYLFGNWSMTFLIALLLVSYPYKFIVAVLMTPFLYAVHFVVKKYLGVALATKLKNNASQGILE